MKILIDEKLLVKTLGSIIKTGKYVLGEKEVSQSVKGSKLVIFAQHPFSKEVFRKCGEASVPTYIYQGNSEKLGRICGKHFRVSVFAIKSAGDIPITPLLEEPGAKE